MRRLLWWTLIVVLIASLCGCAANGFIPDWPQDQITLRVYNGYTGTYQVQLWLSRYDINAPVLTLMGPSATLSLPVRDYKGYRLTLTDGFNGVLWYSQDLYGLKVGSCFELHVESQLAYSGLFACHSSAHGGNDAKM